MLPNALSRTYRRGVRGVDLLISTIVSNAYIIYKGSIMSTYQKLNNIQINALYKRIEETPTYLSMTVLDRGLVTILVLTTEDKWFLLHQGKWEQLSDKQAQSECTNHYFSNRYDEMIAGI